MSERQTAGLSKKEGFRYTVARFTPDQTRGEFLNVGVIVWRPDTDMWRANWIRDTRRIRAVWPHLHANLITSPLQIIKGMNFGLKRFWDDEWKNFERSLISFRKPLGGVTESLDIAVQDLYQDFVGDPPDWKGN